MPSWPIGLDFGSDTASPWGGSPGRQGAGAYGGIPQLPPYTRDISTSVGPDVYAQLTRNLPGYQGMVSKSSQNIAANQAGQLSPDVIAVMQQQAAERGIATGTEGSQANNAAYLRALGLTSQQLQQLSESQLTEAIKRTPIQQTQTGTQMTDLAAQQAIYNAAPNPMLAAQASLAAARSGMGAGYGGGAMAPSYQPTPLQPLSATDQGGYQSPYSYTAPQPFAGELAPGLTYGMGAGYGGGSAGGGGSIPGLTGGFDETQFNVGPQTMSWNYGILPQYPGSYPIMFDQNPVGGV